MVCEVRVEIPGHSDPPAIQSLFSYDGAGLRIAESIEHFATEGQVLGDGERIKVVQTMEFDGAGRPVSRTNRLGQSVSFAYDARNRRRGRTDIRGSVHETVYDSNGNPKYMVERNSEGIRGKFMDYVGFALREERLVVF